MAAIFLLNKGPGDTPTLLEFTSSVTLTDSWFELTDDDGDTFHSRLEVDGDSVGLPGLGTYSIFGATPSATAKVGTFTAIDAWTIDELRNDNSPLAVQIKSGWEDRRLRYSPELPGIGGDLINPGEPLVAIRATIAGFDYPAAAESFPTFADLPNATAPPLADYGAFTFNRASAATWEVQPGVVQTYASNELRVLDNNRVALEGASTNNVVWSEDWSDPAWLLFNDVSVTAGQADPASGTGAALVTLTGNTPGSNVGQASATAPQKRFSVFVKRGSQGTVAAFRAGNPSGDTDIPVVPLDWRRFFGSNTSGLGTAEIFIANYLSPINAGAPVSGDNHYFAFPQDEYALQELHTSYIPTASVAATRLADELVSATIPSPVLETGVWEFDLLPGFDSTSMLNAQNMGLFNFRTGGYYDYVAIYSDGAGNPKLRIVEDNVVVLDAGPFTFTRGRFMQFRLDLPAGEVTISGANTGDGVYSAAPWDFAPASNPEFRVGALDSGTFPYYGAISAPRPA